MEKQLQSFLYGLVEVCEAIHNNGVQWKHILPTGLLSIVIGWHSS